MQSRHLIIKINKEILMSSKIALISGITGQDGSYLAELLIDKGYIVHGIIRRSSSFNTFRIDHLYKDESILNKKLFLHYGDLNDSSNLNRLVEKIKPYTDEIEGLTFFEVYTVLAFLFFASKLNIYVLARRSGFYPEIWISGYPDFRAPRFPEFRKFGFPNIRISGYPGMAISRLLRYMECALELTCHLR